MHPIRALCDKLRRHGDDFAEVRSGGIVVDGSRSVLLARGSIRSVAFHPVAHLVADEPAPAPTPLPTTEAQALAQSVVLSDLHLTRGDRAVLSDITLAMSERRIGILGLNGSGKSSLLKLLVGLLAPTSGSVRLDGLDPCADASTVRSRTGFLFQNADNQIVYPIVREDLAFGLAGLAEDVQRVIDATLARLGIADLADRRIHELSGGERQLVALAGVLARDPLTILFDEPTSQLDLANRNRFRDILAALPQQAIVVTHDLDLVADFDRVLVVEDGRIVCDAAPDAAVAFYRGRHP